MTGLRGLGARFLSSRSRGRAPRQASTPPTNKNGDALPQGSVAAFEAGFGGPVCSRIRQSFGQTIPRWRSILPNAMRARLWVMRAALALEWPVSLATSSHSAPT